MSQIRILSNHTNRHIHMENMEHYSDSVVIAPWDVINFGWEPWIPHCGDSGWFPYRHIRFRDYYTGTVFWHLYDRDWWLRVWNLGFERDAGGVIAGGSAASTAHNNKHIHIGNDGQAMWAQHA